MRSMTVFVPGDPRPQGSKVGVLRPNGSVWVKDDSPGLAKWRNDVTFLARAAMRGAEPFPHPVAVELTFCMKGAAQQPPDIDKLSRSILDSLTVAQVYFDDGQVVQLRATKVGDRPHADRGVRITVLEVPS